jgi:hypothetical protein
MLFAPELAERLECVRFRAAFAFAGSKICFKRFVIFIINP